ncbi:MAG TPA: ABC transporter substrate-binding protein, partial [Acidothermaceae bacterium]|nr:ABC transporter substrate-binding protein [Acidothermaceae bacterium]
MRSVTSAGVVAVALVAAGCGGSNGVSSSSPSVDIIVSAPVSTSPWIAEFERNGAQLAADQVNARGGIRLDGRKRRIVIKVMDNAGSPQQAAAIARTAVSDHAAALLMDGVGAAAVADVTDPANLPTFVVFDGGASIVDPVKRPTIFRLAPADKYMTMRLADYLAGRHPRIAIIADDTSYGSDGLSSLRSAFQRDEINVVNTSTVASSATDV